MVSPHVFDVEVVLGRLDSLVAEFGFALTEFGFDYSVRFSSSENNAFASFKYFRTVSSSRLSPQVNKWPDISLIWLLLLALGS